MARFRRLDALLLVSLSGLWCLCFVLHLNQLARGGFAWIPIYVDSAPAPDAYPTLRGFWPGLESLAPELRQGDELRAIAGEDLAGAGRLQVVEMLYAAPAVETIVITAARASERVEATLSLQPIPMAWRKTLVALGFAVLGSLGFWRTRGSTAGRAFYLAMMAYAFHWTDFFGGAAPLTLSAIVVFGVSTTLTAPLALRAFQIFPEELPRRTGVQRAWPWLFLAVGPMFTIWAFGLPFPLAGASSMAVALNALYLAALIALLTINFRRCGPRGRRQLKWVVLGFWVGLVPVFLSSLLAAVAPELWWLYEASLVLTLAIPICLFIALVRFNLFDVNRLLTSAATYSVIGTVSLAGVFLVVPRASAAAADWIEPAVSQPMLALTLAGLALVGLRLVDGVLQTRLYPERRALEAEAGRLRNDLATCEKPGDVLLVLGARLRSLLQLETVALYVRADSTFAPVFAHGSRGSPVLEGDGPLAHHLQNAGTPVDPGSLDRSTLLEPDWAALASMGVELVVPITLNDELAAFICLGGKGSGDIFTPSDVALLMGLADKAADELRRFERAEVERQTRELSERLRRYVPSAVAREIDEGFQLDPGERDVSILFVDIRGYTPFSEGQQPDAIFAAVSQYTELVSHVVDEYGGSVVEFHGDGLMAVFGAPRPLKEKECCAVRAALAISEGVPLLEFRGSDGNAQRLGVGVGIATGSAYVGPLKTADRSIWVALGNTTILAARLEGATRTLEVAIVVDAETRDAAGGAATAFVSRPELSLKGRSMPIDVFTWSRVVQENGP